MELSTHGQSAFPAIDEEDCAKVGISLSICERGSLREEDVFDLHRLVINEQSFDIYKPVGAYKREDNGTYRPGPDGKSVYRPYLAG